MLIYFVLLFKKKLKNFFFIYDIKDFIIMTIYISNINWQLYYIKHILILIQN